MVSPVRSPTAEPVLYVALASAVAQGFIASPRSRWPARRKVAAAVATSLVTAMIARQLVSPFLDAPEQHPANAGLPPDYQPPPRLPSD